jgi:hypothetical protein
MWGGRPGMIRDRFDEYFFARLGRRMNKNKKWAYRKLAV